MRRPSPAGHRPALSGSSASRGCDVAVTCRQRLRGPVVDGPAARLLAVEQPLSHGTAPGHPTSVDVLLGPHLVAARAAEIRAVVDLALAADPVVLRLRLDDVQQFDAAGVGLLLHVHRAAGRRGIDLVCSCPPRQLVAVLRRTNLDRVLTLRP